MLDTWNVIVVLCIQLGVANDMIVLRISLMIIAAVPQLPSWREEEGLFESPGRQHSELRLNTIKVVQVTCFIDDHFRCA